MSNYYEVSEKCSCPSWNKRASAGVWDKNKEKKEIMNATVKESYF